MVKVSQTDMKLDAEKLALEVVSRVRTKPLEHPFSNLPTSVIRTYHNFSDLEYLKFWDVIHKELPECNDLGGL